MNCGVLFGVLSFQILINCFMFSCFIFIYQRIQFLLVISSFYQEVISEFIWFMLFICFKEHYHVMIVSCSLSCAVSRSTRCVQPVPPLSLSGQGVHFIVLQSSFLLYFVFSFKFSCSLFFRVLRLLLFVAKFIISPNFICLDLCVLLY